MRGFAAIKIALVLALFLAVIGISAFFYFNYDIPILMYHHIAAGAPGDSLSVSPDNFEKQMRYLDENGYSVLTLEELAAFLDRNKLRPRHTVAITFDDGYEDNYIHAFKILRKYNFPAAVFVSPDLVGKKGYLNWRQIKEMSENGIAIGSHTLTHAYLPSLNSDQIMKELQISQKILAKKLNRPTFYLCYPVGGFSKAVQEIASSLGYRMAFSTNRGIIKTRRNEDLLALRRIKIKSSANRFVLWAKLSGYYNLFRKVKDPY
jgi:peptidoglycan/xylan/chitin deacetylase (PgdA/CDA1 family)